VIKKLLKIDEEGKSVEQNLNKLIADRIDCYINDRLAIFDTLRKMKMKNKDINFPDINVIKVISSESGYVGYSKNQDSEFDNLNEFKNRLNIILTEMKNSGQIRRIINKYIE